ncbi:hypothetical protein AMTRI_Chr09g38110 [Amborella trichopoda]
MDKMRALQFRLIQNLHARLLAVRQGTQRNQRKKDLTFTRSCLPQDHKESKWQEVFNWMERLRPFVR